MAPVQPGSDHGRGLPEVAFERVPDPDSETVYLVAPRGANLSDALEPGRRYGARFVLNESSPFVSGLATPDVEERESIGRNFTAVAPVANFSSVSEEGTLDFAPAAGVPVDGTTTVASGTELTVRVNSSDPDTAFTVESETTVEEDGTYETDLNLTEYDAGTNYTVSVSANGERISPLRTGQLTETQAGASGAAAGAGGAGYPAGQDGPVDTPGGTGTTSESTADPQAPDETTDGGGVLDPSEYDSIPERSLPDLPLPLVLGTESLVSILLLALALLVIGYGLRRIL